MSEAIPKLSRIQRLSRAFKTYFSLDQEQKKIIQSGQIEGAHTPDYWIHMIQKNVEFDYYADSVRAFIGSLSGITLGLFLFISIFLLAFLFESEIFLIIYLLVFFILVPSCLIGLVIYFFLKNKDIRNHLRAFTFPLLTVLREEMESTELLHLRVDLRKKARKDNQTHAEQNYKSNALSWLPLASFASIFIFGFLGAFTEIELFFFIALFAFFSTFILFFVSSFSGKYPKIKTTYHDYSWLEVRGKLSDNALLMIQVRDEIRKIKITRKRRRRGKTKIKTKTKYKIVSNFMVELSLPLKKYEVADAFSPDRDTQGVKMKMKPNQKRNKLKIQGRQKSKSIHETADFDYFLNLVARGYRNAQQNQPPTA